MILETRITVSAPGVVQSGEPVPVTGRLEYNALYAWLPLSGATVRILLDGRQVGAATTQADGSYAYAVPPPPPGTHTVTAVYDGDWLHKPCSASAAVQVAEPQEYPLLLLRRHWWLALAAVAAGAGAALALALKKR